MARGVFTSNLIDRNRLAIPLWLCEVEREEIISFNHDHAELWLYLRAHYKPLADGKRRFRPLVRSDPLLQRIGPNAQLLNCRPFGQGVAWVLASRFFGSTRFL